ncbi:hypothetical protein DRH14_01580 [Candidatus Shapirobacteria bacterium]|nr:MAG: hypothetical protein DRH14_01580 [Candidatus Shapirobacteria bacterium]
MVTQALQRYKNLEKTINQSINSQTHLIIFTLPGMGAGYNLRQYCKKHPRVPYIDTPSQKLSSLSIVNLHLANKPTNIQNLSTYLTKLKHSQKLVIVSDIPFDLLNKHLQHQHIWKHFYSHYYFQPLNKKDAQLMLNLLKISINQSQFNRIYQKSQGIPKLLKYLSLHISDFDQKSIEHILSPLQNSIQLYSPQIISQKFHIDTSQLPQTSTYTIIPTNIKINFNLTFTENGITNPNQLTKDEAEILKKMLNNQFNITKEEISDIKWGKDTYDKFSDQAIGQTMRRLRHKLQYYTIKSIPKTGYQLKTKLIAK